MPDAGNSATPTNSNACYARRSHATRLRLSQVPDGAHYPVSPRPVRQNWRVRTPADYCLTAGVPVAAPARGTLVHAMTTDIETTDVLYPAWRRPLLLHGLAGPPAQSLDRSRAVAAPSFRDAAPPAPRGLVISGTLGSRPVAVNVQTRPPLLFDYYGFPDHTYQLKYPAPGDPPLAAEIRSLLAAAGIASRRSASAAWITACSSPFC